MHLSIPEQRERHHKQMVLKLKKELKKIYLGGGLSKIKKEHDKGKMTARERIDYLLDKDKNAIEIAPLAAYDMYEKEGGCPCAGVVVKIGYVKDKICIIVANDATVKSGAWFPMTGKKSLRAQEIAMENHIPIIYLVDSAGIYLPLQEDIFADRDHFGRIFRNNARLNAMGILQIAAVMGSCVAGGAYLPIMSDEAIMVDKTSHIFLAGSHLVKAAIGEIVDNETLGGATTHCEISGVIDHKAKNDKEALDKIKNIFDKIGEPKKAGFNKKKASLPKRDIKEIYKIIPIERSESYDMYHLLECLIDDSYFEEYKAGYGKTIICGFARIKGWSIGIIANQRKAVKDKKGEIQIGGVIYPDSSKKTSEFIDNCNQKKIPLLFLQDVTGFMIGSTAEHSGIIDYGAKLIHKVSNAKVPKFTILIGNSYGAGYYALCGRAFDPRFLIAWPSAQIAVMGGIQASKVLVELEKRKSIESTQKELNEEDIISNDIFLKYQNQSSPYYAEARVWIDALIDPLDTREWIDMGIQMANHNSIN